MTTNFASYLINKIQTKIELYTKKYHRAFNINSDFLQNSKRKIYTTIRKNNFFEQYRDNINVEHIVPKNLFLSHNKIYAHYDVYNLFYAFIKINSYRNNAKFGIVNEPTLIFNQYGQTLIYDSSMKKYAYYDCDINYPLSIDEKKCNDIYECNLNRLSKDLDFTCAKSLNMIDKNANVLKDNFSLLCMDKNLKHIDKFAEDYLSVIYICNSKCTFEPINKEKGIIARTLLYMYTMYIWSKKANMQQTKNYDLNDEMIDDFFNDSKLKLYQEWNKLYPPENDEIIESIYIASEFGYLNPFIMYCNADQDYIYNNNLYEDLVNDKEYSINIEISGYSGNYDLVVPYIYGYEFNSRYLKNITNGITKIFTTAPQEIISYHNYPQYYPEYPQYYPEYPQYYPEYPQYYPGYPQYGNPSVDYRKKYIKYKKKYMQIKKSNLLIK